MKKSLYINGRFFSDQPSGTDYESFRKRIFLKEDLGWTEEKDLRDLIEKSDLWDDFPSQEYTLISVETKAGDEDQYIDLLYLRDDGALLPCELKIGGKSLDTHGQLIRYIADLTFQKVNIEFVKNLNQNYLSHNQQNPLNAMMRHKFESFLIDNNISDKFIRVLPRSGILMDELFKPQIMKSVRYLNEQCGFSIRLIEIRTFTDDNWTRDSQNLKCRIDFVERT
jgi:hypothetical protein